MIKALFFDLDGTLLNSDKRISSCTINALVECKNKGIKDFTATGRPPLLQYTLPLSSEELSLLDDGGVFYNGACISQGPYKKYFTLDEYVIDITVRTVQEYPGIKLALQGIGEKHSFNFEINEESFSAWGIVKKHLVPYDQFKTVKAVKLYIYSDNYSIDLCELHDVLLQQVEKTANLYLTCCGKSIEIVSKNISKKSGIEQIIKLSGIDRSEVAVFGDDTNDFEMLSGFPNSIAMGTAPDSIKAASSYITCDNNNDGIYYALRDYLGLISFIREK